MVAAKGPLEKEKFRIVVEGRLPTRTTGSSATCSPPGAVVAQSTYSTVAIWEWGFQIRSR